jgi:hypothetical protein
MLGRDRQRRRKKRIAYAKTKARKRGDAVVTLSTIGAAQSAYNFHLRRADVS